MADSAKVGKDWQDDELDAIVADYFEMLAAEVAGRDFVKLAHSRALMARIGRTHRSVEFKHQNISAVLEQMGMPWIRGYKPKRNYQRALFAAIDRYLTREPFVLELVPPSPSPPADSGAIFVPPPILAARRAVPEPLRRLVRKFDPVERDHRNHSLGKAGEKFVIELERQRLGEAGRSDLARRVRWVSQEDGDGAGYDVFSFESMGQERLLEVKTTNGAARTPFYLSRNERELASERPADWRIYRVHLFAERPQIFVIAPPLESAVHLTVESWRASF